MRLGNWIFKRFWVYRSLLDVLFALFLFLRFPRWNCGVPPRQGKKITAISNVKSSDSTCKRILSTRSSGELITNQNSDKILCEQPHIKDGLNILLTNLLADLSSFVQPGVMDLESRTRNYNDGPPWVFKGRAFYQLNLVKAEVARRFIPPELKVVQAFGYTLGGFYLAHYDSSPAGVFDELVVLAGIVWNPPTSCAWAARVLVNSKEACEHGIKEVGLPSRTAQFSLMCSKDEFRCQRPWWNILPKKKSQEQNLSVEISETNGSKQRPLCNIELSNAGLGAEGSGWLGPNIQMPLPSFSGKTQQQPELLKYSCNLNCRVRPVAAARVSSPSQKTEEDKGESSDQSSDVLSMLTGKPLMSIAFEKMVMHVDAPTVVASKITKDIHISHDPLNRPKDSEVPTTS